VSATLMQMVEVALEPADLAKAFIEMNDEEQVDFFVEVARLMADWPAHAREMQKHYIARHLATCECATDSAREMLCDIVDTMRRERDREPREPDGEVLRGSQAAEFLAEQQERAGALK
jgi:hypothetical protein